MDSSLLDSGDTGYEQGIVHFLQKPFPLTNGTISTVSTGQITTFNVFNDILSKSVYADKLKGFLAFRATTVVRLQINANRFQQGRLLMHFLPQATVNNMNTAGLRNVNLTTITQHPRVELDINSQTEAVLEIPYTSPQSFYNLQTGVGNLGSFYLHIYSPLSVSSGSTGFDYQIWVSFKDVELMTPSTGNLTFGTQMDESEDLIKRVKKRSEISKKQRDFGKNLGGRIKTVVKGDNKNRKDEERIAAGPVETITGYISNGLQIVEEAVDTFIPSISTYVKPLIWVTDVANGLAHAFGWSKRTITAPAVVMRTGLVPNICNTDGVDTAQALSGFQTNEIKALPGFAGTDVDEMSLSYLTQIPAYIESFSFSTSNVTDDELYSKKLDPRLYYNTGTTTDAAGTYTYCTYAPITYFSSFFRYYRGSIRFIFKVVKTEFHSGRILVSYSPSSTVGSNNADSTFLFREIVDLRETSEFSFVLPYASATPWRPIFPMFGSDEETSYGVLSVNVLNELVAPATVPSSINFLVEVSAAPDYELMGPSYSKSSYISATQDGTQYPFITQMDDETNVMFVNKGIGSSKIVGAGNLAPAEYCVGERYTSIKQILLRYCNLRFNGVSALSGVYYLNPFVIPAVAKTAASGPINEVINGDNYSMLASCFAYSRGSIRIGWFKNSNSGGGFSNQLYFRVTSDTNPCSVTSTGDSSVQFGPITNAGNVGTASNFVDFKVPMYTRTHSMLNRLSAGSGNRPQNDVYNSKVGVVTRFSNTTDTVTLMRAVGDDFQLGYFIGVPPMYQTYTN